MHTDQLVDHKDRNPFNNQKENLRVATHAQNMQNRAKYDRNGSSTSAYKGVYKNKATNKWHARIKVNGVRLSLGYHWSENDAAKAYNEAAIKYHKEFAVLNEIKVGVSCH